MANEDKLWAQQNLYALAKSAALEIIQSQGGLALPCKVIALNPNNPATGQPLGYSFVQVQFEVNVPYTLPDGTTGTYTLPPLILPKAEGQWVRSSTQVGDLGMTQALDTSHGAVSGMYAGVANTGTAYGNLSTLVFVPLGNASFGAAPDPNKAWVNGPAGSVVSDTAQTVKTVHDMATVTVMHQAGTAATAPKHTLDGINEKIQSAIGGQYGTIEQVIDAVANKITHSLVNSSGSMQIILDGVANTLAHIVPTGGAIGIGALPGSIPSTGAISRNADLTTLIGVFGGPAGTINVARTEDIIYLVTAMIASGVPNAGAILGNLATLVSISVPACSTVTKSL